MQNKEQENTEVFEEKEKAEQKKKKLNIDKKYIQGFIAGILVSAIVFTGLLTGFNPGFLTGTARNQGSIICDISQGNVIILQSKNDCLIFYYDPNLGNSKRRVEAADLPNTQITIKGSTNSNNIQVDYLDYADGIPSENPINIVLDGASINGSFAALSVEKNATVNLTIKNENVLIAYGDTPGIIRLGGSLVNISGPGSLITNYGSKRPLFPLRFGLLLYDQNVNVDIVN